MKKIIKKTALLLSLGLLITSAQTDNYNIISNHTYLSTIEKNYEDESIQVCDYAEGEEDIHTY